MSYKSWERANAMLPCLPVRAWRTFLLLIKSTRFSLKHIQTKGSK